MGLAATEPGVEVERSNPTPSAILAYFVGIGWDSNAPNHDNPDGHGWPSAEAATDGHGF